MNIFTFYKKDYNIFINVFSIKMYALKFYYLYNVKMYTFSIFFYTQILFFYTHCAPFVLRTSNLSFSPPVLCYLFPNTIISYAMPPRICTWRGFSAMIIC